MSDSELIWGLISNAVGAITFGIFLAVFFYLREIRNINDPAIIKRRFTLGAIWLFVGIALSIWLWAYGVYIPFPGRI